MENRRKSDRFNLKEDVFILLSKTCLWKINRTSRLFAPIVDINFKGISFKYIDKGMFPLEYNLISILLPNKMHAIECLPIKTIHDRKISDLPRKLELRKRGGKFEFFNQEKKTEFESFFHQYAMMCDQHSKSQTITNNYSTSLVA